MIKPGTNLINKAFSARFNAIGLHGNDKWCLVVGSYHRDDNGHDMTLKLTLIKAFNC